MLSPSESRRALVLVTDAAVADAQRLVPLGADAIAEGVPEVVGYYTLGSSALAADYYDEERLRAEVRGRFTAEPVIPDRAEKVRRAALWAAAPMFSESIGQTVASRIAEVVQLEVAKAHRETILTNRRRDPQSAGWKRIASGSGCKFCQMLAGKGTVYTAETARFASHPNCSCTAQPWFKGQPLSDPADPLQYLASKRTRTPEQRARLRDYLNGAYPDSPG